MRLASARHEGRNVAVVVTDAGGHPVTGFANVSDLLQADDWKDRAAGAATGPVRGHAEFELTTLVPRPGKIICVGLNYRAHIEEMGRELPEHPTLFAKFSEALIGPNDPIELPPESTAVDWEAELGLVIGTPARRVGLHEAERHIAGYCVVNDVTMRDFQYRTTQWLQGKTWERSTPIGPWLVTPDEFSLGAELVGSVDGEVVQKVRTDDLVFGPAQLVSYISTIVTLNPGDVIATGTPGGVGHARTPRRYLRPGAMLETRIEGLGAQRNVIQASQGS